MTYPITSWRIRLGKQLDEWIVDWPSEHGGAEITWPNPQMAKAFYIGVQMGQGATLDEATQQANDLLTEEIEMLNLAQMFAD